MIVRMTAMMLNAARKFMRMAQQRPDATAVAEPLGYDSRGKRIYRSVTFRQLNEDSGRIALGLRAMGVRRGTRLALLVPPGIDFISLDFALLKSGATTILIDPGMGKRNLVGCLAEAEPEGFIAVPRAQAVRAVMRKRFPKANLNVTVGRRWFWGGPTLARLRAIGASNPPCDPADYCDDTAADDPAAIIFTTGSTGPPKGVEFSHRNFDSQVEQIRDFYDIRPGETDVPCFPLFGLFNCAMGATAVFPEMDPSRPALVDPRNIIEAVADWRATRAFGSPAVWDRVGKHCQMHGVAMPTVRRVLSAGAPIPAEVLRLMRACIHAEGEVHTPYGATEALPVASISAGEVLGLEHPKCSSQECAIGSASAGTGEQTRLGRGVCVGRRFAGVRWRVVKVVDGPITSLDETQELPRGEIGELIVHGPMVTRRYVTRVEANALAKIADGDDIWHRMGDCGYLDAQDRFWFCGRVAHRVLTAAGPMYPVCCEAIVNCHPAVRRSALVGIGAPGNQRPVFVVEPLPGKMPRGRRGREEFFAELRALAAANPLTHAVDDFLLHPSFPVDIRHNAKIFREKLAVWAAKRL